MRWNARRRFAFSSRHRGAFGFCIGVSVGANQVDVIHQRGVDFRFSAFRTHLARIFEPAFSAVIGRYVVLSQIVQRQGHQRGVDRLIFHANLGLLPSSRPEWRNARRTVGLQVRFKRGAVADVRRQARIKRVQQASAPGKFAVVLLRKAVIGKVVGTHFAPVVAPGNQPLPVVPAHLILKIQAHLVEILLLVGGRFEGTFIHVHAVNRVCPVEVIL